MKKLLLNNQESHLISVMNFTPSYICYSNNNSFFGTPEKEMIKGFCVNCDKKSCLSYTRDEVMPIFFNSFPHNTDFRVCPTKAITINKETKYPTITENCIGCGLCIHRCPFAAIQFSLDEGKCFINTESNYKTLGSKALQDRQAIKNSELKKIISYSPITVNFSTQYTSNLKKIAKNIPDLSEIIVRNSLINLGNRCVTNAKGNNHFRIEFFAESTNKYIIGESEITETDTLAVTRRILDDLAVLIGRYKIEKEKLLPLAVINGFPNKRTDFYSVVEDVRRVLNIQINSLSFHILFVLNLYNIKLTDKEISQFIIEREKNNLLEQVSIYIPNIKEVDCNIHTNCYEPKK